MGSLKSNLSFIIPFYWLPVDVRIHFQIPLIAYKAVKVWLRCCKASSRSRKDGAFKAEQAFSAFCFLMLFYGDDDCA